MSVDLNQEVCANCGVRLTDRNTVVEDDGLLYCCRNCFIHAVHPETQAAPGEETCAHCGMTLIDKQSRVQQGSKVFCCGNCANATERAFVGRPV